MMCAEEVYQMVRVCAWCKRTIGYVDCEPDMNGKVTHSICDDCATVMRAEADSIEYMPKRGCKLED